MTVVNIVVPRWMLFSAFLLSIFSRKWFLIRSKVDAFGGPHFRTRAAFTGVGPSPRTLGKRSLFLSMSSSSSSSSPPALDMTDRMAQSWNRVASKLFEESSNSTVQSLQRVLVQRGYDFDTHRRRFDLKDTTWAKLAGKSCNLPTLSEAETTSSSWNGTRYITESRHPGEGDETTIVRTTRFLQQASTLDEWESGDKWAESKDGDDEREDYDSARMGFQDNGEEGEKEVEESGPPLSSIHPQDDVMVVEREILRSSPQAEEEEMVAQYPRELYGRSYAGEQPLISPLEKVPGCIANVWIRTRLIPLVSPDKDEDSAWFFANRFRILVDGEADALISRGLLALVTDALHGSPIHARGQQGRMSKASIPTAGDVLSIAQPPQVAQALQLQSLLSPGRNDGLASMLQTVQQQLQDLLQQRQDQKLQDMTPKLGRARPSPKASTPSEPLHQPESSDPPRVALLLSGGVDSSVALHWLVRQGYNVTAFYIRIWLEDEMASSSSTVEALRAECPWEEDYVACMAVCEPLGVPLRVLSLQEEYQDQVVGYTIQQAKRGRTPNPDVLCNSRIKFGCFLNAISPDEFDWVASGHYAQTSTMTMAPKDTLLRRDKKEEEEKEEDVVRLYRSVDAVKDQSYFLATLRQDQLRRILFPIGHLSKEQVRELAHEWNLPNAYRPDSQGLCFLGQIRFDDFLQSYLGTAPGPIVDSSSGTVLGNHRGLWFHTVGQRKGLGPSLFPEYSSQGPFYVVAKDPTRNVIFVSNQYEKFTKTRTQFVVQDIAWIGGQETVEEIAKALQDNDANGNVPHDPQGESYIELSLDMKIRHGPRIAQGTLQLKDETSISGRVRLQHKDIGLAPGQFVAFYSPTTQECLGSSVISEEHWLPYRDYPVNAETPRRQKRDPRKRGSPRKAAASGWDTQRGM